MDNASMDIFIQVFVWIYFLLDGYEGVELLGHRVNLWLTLLGNCQSPKVLHYFIFPLECANTSFFTISPTYIFHFSHFGGCVKVLHCRICFPLITKNE